MQEDFGVQRATSLCTKANGVAKVQRVGYAKRAMRIFLCFTAFCENRFATSFLHLLLSLHCLKCEMHHRTYMYTHVKTVGRDTKPREGQTSGLERHHM